MCRDYDVKVKFATKCYPHFLILELEKVAVANLLYKFVFCLSNLLHPVQFIRNTVFLGIVLFLNFSKNSTSSVAYLFLNFYMMKYSLVSKNISLNSFLYQACQKYGDCTVSWTYLKSLNSFHLIM